MLLPKDLAVEATPENLNKLQGQQASAQHKVDVDIQNAKATAEKLKDQKVIINAKAGSNGKLFGSVTAGNVAEAIEKQFGVKIDKKKIVMNGTIREIGITHVTVKLHPQVTAELKVDVKSEG